MSGNEVNGKRADKKMGNNNIDQKLYLLLQDIRDEFGHKIDSVKSEIQNQYRIDSQALDLKLRKYFKIALIILGFLGLTSIGGIKWFVYRTSQVLEAEVKHVQEKVSRRLDTEFESEKIKSLIEETAKRYTEGEVQKYISNRVDKSIILVRESLDEKLQEASKLVSELQLAREFTMAVIRVQNDDREAFGQLKVWANDESHPFSSYAKKVLCNVEIGCLYEVNLIYGLKWSEGVDPSQYTIEDLLQIYKSEPVDVKPSFIHYVWERQDIPKKNRIQFLIDVIQND